MTDLFAFGMTLNGDGFWEAVDDLTMWFDPFKIKPDDDVPEWGYIVSGGWYLNIGPWQMQQPWEDTVLLWGTEQFMMEPLGLLGGPEVYVV